MKIVGAHLSIAKGYYTARAQMESLKADTCAIFLKSPRCFNSKPLADEAIAKFKKYIPDASLFVPHGSYLINIANPDTAEKSYACMLDDLKRCHALGITYYNLHPGADVKGLGNKARELIATNVNRVLEEVPDVILLLENMAGQGTVCGRTFEDLALIIENIREKGRIGVTLDTCHMFAAGYDIRTKDGFVKVMAEFDKVVGLGYLKAVHLNDSKQPLGSRKDAHEQIGKGHIGLEAFEFIMNSDIFDGIPMILETPDDSKYGEEIELLRSLVKHCD